MIAIEDSKVLKTLLLYQGIINYLSDEHLVEIMEADEKEFFKDTILECFRICKSYKGSTEDLKSGCTQLLSTKEDISRFCPEVNDIINA